MRRQVWVRKYNEKTDRKLFLDFLYAGREENRFDPRIFEKNQTTIFTCYDEGGIVGFIPVVVCMAVESLAWRPGLPASVRAQALKSFQVVLVEKASEMNAPYAFMATTNETYADFLTQYGWKRAVVPVLTLPFADLCPEIKEAEGTV